MLWHTVCIYIYYIYFHVCMLILLFSAFLASRGGHVISCRWPFIRSRTWRRERFGMRTRHVFGWVTHRTWRKAPDLSLRHLCSLRNWSRSPPTAKRKTGLPELIAFQFFPISIGHRQGFLRIKDNKIGTDPEFDSTSQTRMTPGWPEDLGPNTLREALLRLLLNHRIHFFERSRA